MTRKFIPLLLALAVAACSDAKPDDATEPTVVQIARAVPAKGASEIVATGKLARLREINLSFRVPGVLRRVAVDDGDNVRAGQLLAAIDPAQYDAAYDRAKAALDQAERDYARDKKLFASGFVSNQRLADRETALTAARAGFQSAAFDKRWTVLSAPSNGVILNRASRAGEVVSPGQAIFMFADETSPIILKAELSDREIAKVKIGQAADVTFTALPGKTLSGTITRIGEHADAQTGAYEVEIRLPEDPALKSGFVASARIPLAGGDKTMAAAVMIPAESIFEVSGGKGRVFVLSADGKAAKRVNLTFIGFEGDSAVVTGLPAGARVITAGGAYVNDGSKIRVVAGEAS